MCPIQSWMKSHRQYTAMTWLPHVGLITIQVNKKWDIVRRQKQGQKIEYKVARFILFEDTLLKIFLLVAAKMHPSGGD